MTAQTAAPAAPELDETLHVELTAEAKVKVRIDVAAYFAGMNVAEQRRYRDWTDPDQFWEGTRHTRPIDYLTWCIDQETEISSGQMPERPAVSATTPTSTAAGRSVPGR